MPAPLVYGAMVAGSVAFEYGYHRLSGDKATTKELVTAAAFGALPIAKLKLLKVPYRALKFRSYRLADDARYLVPFGTRVIKRPFTVPMGRAAPYVGAAWIGAPVVSYGIGRGKRHLFSQAYDLVTGSSGVEHTSRSGTTKRGISLRKSMRGHSAPYTVRPFRSVL